MRKGLKYIFIFIPLALFVAVNVSAAGFLEESEHYISKDRLNRHGKTVETLQQEFRLGIFPHAARDGAQVSLKIGNPSIKMQQKLPANYHFVSPVYHYNVRRVAAVSPFVLPKRKAAFTAAHDPRISDPRLFKWNQKYQRWEPVRANPIKNKPWLATWTTESSGVVAVLSKEAPSPRLSPPKGEGEPNFGITTRAASMIILDATSKELAIKNADEIRPIASLTKLMTAIVLIDEGLDFNKILTYDPDAHYAFRNYMKLKKGEKIRVSDLWYAMLVGSLNVPTRMLVDSIDISETEFINKMNTKASYLGLKNTKFYNTTGLSADLVPGQTEETASTAREVARLLKEALKYPQVASVISRPFYKFEETLNLDGKKEHGFFHTNKLLKKALPYRIVATKTGYTEEAGSCFATLTTSRAGEFLIVSLGDDNYHDRFAEQKRLADWVLMNDK